jgi:NADH-quinone oxidoreductase subunit J
LASEIIQFSLVASVIIFALLAAELRDLMRAALCLGGMCICLGGLYWALYAPYVGLFQMLIYGGAVVVLFISVIMFIRGTEDG